MRKKCGRNLYMEESSTASKVIANYFRANAMSGRCSMLLFSILRCQLMHHNYVKHHPHAAHLTSPTPALRTLIPHDDL